MGGVRVIRRGGRLSVYPRALAFVRRERPRLVVDVQNGLPFGSPLVTRSPVVALVHHVHREQWPIVFGRLGGAIGWWIESVVAPRLYRKLPLRHRLGVDRRRARRASGVDAERITVVPNGIEPAPPVTSVRSAAPRLVVLGRLVPHKRVEHAIEVLARLQRAVAGAAPVRGRRGLVGAGAARHAPSGSGSPARSTSGASSTRRTSTRSWPGPGCTCARRSRRAGAWWSARPAATVCRRWATGRPVACASRSSTAGPGVLVDDLDEMTAAVERLLADDAARARMGARGGPARGGVQLAGERRCVRRRAVRRRGGGQPLVAVVQDVGAGVVGGVSCRRCSCRRWSSCCWPCWCSSWPRP